MAYSDAQRKATAKYRAKAGRVRVDIELNQNDRDVWKAYATARGLTMPAMVRRAVALSMQADGWTEDEKKEELTNE